MGRAARAWIAERFTWDRMADEYAALFREVAA
jgi:glycosyltransferase involved in cell wall biosynthesis